MITEDYVSFETAKLLNNKCFNVPCRSYYSKGGVLRCGIIHCNAELGPINATSAATLSTAMKWLREKHNIHIEPRYFPMPNIYRYVIIHSPVTIKNISSHPQYFNTYEEACEAAIKYCLENLI